MTDCHYAPATLRQPYGDETVNVRFHPPCVVTPGPYGHRGPTVFVFVKRNPSAKVYERKRIGEYVTYPRDGFIAWDPAAEEWAWHNAGTIDVPGATRPRSGKSKSFVPIIRGESEPVGKPATKPSRARAKPNKASKRKGKGFEHWWSSRSRANEVPDFLRSGQRLDDDYVAVEFPIQPSVRTTGS